MRITTAVALITLCCSLPAVAGGPSFGSEGGEVGTGFEAFELGSIEKVSVSGLDLSVAIAWQADELPGIAILRLLESGGEAVLEQKIEPRHGQAVYVLPNAFGEIEKFGLQYFVAVEPQADVFGPVAAGRITPHPFHLQLDCPQSQVCHLGVFPGLYQDAVLSDQDLDAALDAVAGSPEVVGEVLTRFPGLRGALYLWLWQIKRRGGGRGGPCTCIWNASPNQMAGSPGSVGAAHRMLVQPPASATMDYSTDGTTRLGLRVRCYRMKQGALLDVALGQTGEGLLIERLEMQSCPLPVGCVGNVDHAVAYSADYVAQAEGMGSASVQASLTYEVGGNQQSPQEILVEARGAGPQSPPPQKIDLVNTSGGVQPQTAVLSSTARVVAEVGGGATDHALAYAESNFSLSAYGAAQCALQTNVSVTLSHTWPPLNINTTNISLLIGN
ncbi:MAG: hypothetical protein AAF604_24260 [Acidobacteriota bacterium]